MNNQLIIKGMEVTAGELTIKLEELQVGVNMEDGTASEYMAVLKQLLQLIQGEIDQSKNGAANLAEILTNTN